MKIDMKILRWVLLGLYIAVVIGLLGMSYSGSMPHWMFLSVNALSGELFWTIFVIAITFISQAVFILIPGTINLCRPIRRRRLVAPVIIASLMMTVLIIALFVSIIELLNIGGASWLNYVSFLIIGLSWIGWGIVFFIRYKETERYKALKGLISTMIAGSLIELLAAIPSHIIVSRRPGCFVGIGTACGIGGGIMVMLWAFGPGIILLFLREKRKAELGHNAKAWCRRPGY